MKAYNVQMVFEDSSVQHYSCIATDRKSAINTILNNRSVKMTPKFSIIEEITMLQQPDDLDIVEDFEDCEDFVIYTSKLSRKITIDGFTVTVGDMKDFREHLLDILGEQND